MSGGVRRPSHDSVNGIDIIGLVDVFGAAGAKNPEDVMWTLRFAFDTWHRPDGTLCSKTLAVERAVTDVELRVFTNTIRRLSILRARVLLVPDGPAQLLELLGGPAEDEALLRRRAELQAPVTRSDPTFGTLVLESRFRTWFYVDTQWCDAPVRLLLRAVELPELEKALANARTLWKEQRKWEARRRECLLRDLLALKNQTWLKEGERPLGAEEFQSRLVLASVSVFPEGHLEFLHPDDGLFWSHGVQLSGTIDREELEGTLIG